MKGSMVWSCFWIVLILCGARGQQVGPFSVARVTPTRSARIHDGMPLTTSTPNSARIEPSLPFSKTPTQHLAWSVRESHTTACPRGLSRNNQEAASLVLPPRHIAPSTPTWTSSCCVNSTMSRMEL